MVQRTVKGSTDSVEGAARSSFKRFVLKPVWWWRWRRFGFETVHGWRGCGAVYVAQVVCKGGLFGGARCGAGFGGGTVQSFARGGAGGGSEVGARVVLGKRGGGQSVQGRCGCGAKVVQEWRRSGAGLLQVRCRGGAGVVQVCCRGGVGVALA